MPDAPTTEGSIVAYLRLDDSDWNQTLDRAEAKARELGRTDPTIHVAADTADAIAKLEALKAAEGQIGGSTRSVSSDKAANNLATAQTRLAAAERTAANAASAQYLAELRLADVQDKRGRTDLQLATAEEAVARATRNAEAAELKHMAATTALKDAQQATARAALEEAAAQEAAAGASETAGAASNNAAGATVRGMQAQTYAVLGAIALIGPLTAAVVGLGGAFVAEGAVGVAAIAGIKQQMAEGTDVGQHYSAGLVQLKSDLDAIETAAAAGVLDGFESSVVTVNTEMPQLLADTHEFAGMLGQSGSNFLDTVVNGLEVAKPLLEEGAGILQVWTGEMDSWVASGGLKDFVEYAQTQLPRVAVTLESLIKDAILLGEDLAPLSNDILDIVNAIHPLLQTANDVQKWTDNLGKAAPVVKWLSDTIGGALNPIQGLTNGLSQAQPAIDKMTGATDLQKAAQKDAADATKLQELATKSLATEYGMSVGQLNAAQAAQKQTADQASATTRQLQLENDAATLLTNAFTLLNGGSLDVAQAQTGAAAASNTLLDSLKQNGVVIDGNTKAAVANQQAIQQKVAADQQAAEAISKQTGSTVAGTKAFADSKAALEAQLKAQGELTPAVQAYIDKLYAIPPVAKTKVDLDADAAIQRAQDLKAWLDSLTPKTVVVTVQTNQVGAPANVGSTNTVRKYAGGGQVAYLAGGGNPFVPQGTDTVPAMLTPEEFVVKKSSAQHDPGFIRAYNNNPAAALDAVKNKGGDRPIYMDGTLFGVLREMANGEARIVVNQANARQKASLGGGLQEVSL